MAEFAWVGASFATQTRLVSVRMVWVGWGFTRIDLVYTVEARP